MYTLRDRKATDLIPGDRPYAGWSYIDSWIQHAFLPLPAGLLRIESCVIGPWSRAKEARPGNRLRHLELFDGWKNQLGTGVWCSASLSASFVKNGCRMLTAAQAWLDVIPALWFRSEMWRLCQRRCGIAQVGDYRMTSGPPIRPSGRQFGAARAICIAVRATVWRMFSPPLTAPWLETSSMHNTFAIHTGEQAVPVMMPRSVSPCQFWGL